MTSTRDTQYTENIYSTTMLIDVIYAPTDNHIQNFGADKCNHHGRISEAS